LLPTCRLGFSREGLEAPPPLIPWITMTNFIPLMLDSQCLGFTSARGMQLVGLYHFATVFSHFDSLNK
jgi:hypothetical protein